MSFVTCKLWAQAFNQAFMISCTIATALKYGVEYKIPRGGHSPELPVMPWPHLPSWEPSDGLGLPYQETPEQFGVYYEIPYWPKMRLEGYFQSYKYIDPYKEEILKAFGFKWEPLDNTIGIHVRRGDYLLHPTRHPVVTHEYLSQAIKIFTDKRYANFVVCSDDIQWCKNYFDNTYPDLCFVYSEGRTAIGDMELLSGCEHLIISNSTLSWWSGYVNRNPNKIIVTPSEFNWFGPDNKKRLKLTDVIPLEWTRITYAQ